MVERPEGNYYFSFGGCHRWAAHKEVRLAGWGVGLCVLQHSLGAQAAGRRAHKGRGAVRLLACGRAGHGRGRKPLRPCLVPSGLFPCAASAPAAPTPHSGCAAGLPNHPRQAHQGVSRCGFDADAAARSRGARADPLLLQIRCPIGRQLLREFGCCARCPCLCQAPSTPTWAAPAPSETWQAEQSMGKSGTRAAYAEGTEGAGGHVPLSRMFEHYWQGSCTASTAGWRAGKGC